MEESLYHTLQKRLSEKEAEYILQLRDTNKDGVIDKKELMSELINPNNNNNRRPPEIHFTRQQIKEIFLEHDVDGDGCLNARELTKAFSCLGSINPLYKAHHGLAYADDDDDALISEEELDKLMDYVEKTTKRKLK